MRELFITTIAMSSVDSLNPIGITQQFILQGMVKKPRHIWYFILTTGVVNMIFGYLVYYGAMALIKKGVRELLQSHGSLVYSLELLAGLIILFYGMRGVFKTISARKRNWELNSQETEAEEIRTKIRSVSPLALIAVGVVSTVSELTSAVPYFSFLAVLITYDLTFPIITAILVFYNIIYMFPFMVMYFIYIISKDFFDKIYTFFKRILRKVLDLFIPALFCAIAIMVIVDSVINLINV